MTTFTLGQTVKITCSAEQGEIIGLAEYIDTKPQALIRYRAADGRAVESWWAFSAIEAA